MNSMVESTMTQQGQGDVVSRANTMADMLTAGDRIRYGDDAALLRELAEEITSLRTLLSSSRGEQGCDWRRLAGLAIAQAAYVIKNYDNTLSREPHPILRVLDELLAAAPSAPGSVPTSLAGQVPDGYVLVPKEPTSEMLEAADAEYPRGSLIEKKLDRRKYKAMLSAAPQPTAGRDANAK
jgi:hypothetical protein